MQIMTSSDLMKGNKQVLRGAVKQRTEKVGGKHFERGEVVFIRPEVAPLYRGRALYVGKVVNLFRRTDSYNLHMYDDTNSSFIGLDLRKVILKHDNVPFVISGVYAQRLVEYWLHDWNSTSGVLGASAGEMAILQWRELRNGQPLHESYSIIGLTWSGKRLI